MKVASRLYFLSRYSLRKLSSHLDVVRHLSYAYIIESSALRRLLSVTRPYIRILQRIAYKFGYRESSMKGMDQALENSLKRQPKFVQMDFQEEDQKRQRIKDNKQMSQLPVVFIHYSNSDYLKYSLGQAKHSNPESIVYLIGDSSNNCYDYVEHHSISDYSQGAEEFATIYRHFNSLSFKYTLFNFQRWFILRDFLIYKKFPKCLHVDSDTMLYADVSSEQRKFAQYDFTVSHRISGCTFFLNRVGALEEFCEFLMDIYTKRDRYHYDRMVSHYAVRKKNHLMGGVCEMTAFDYYGEAHFGEIGEVAQIIDESVYDPNINIPHPDFEMENGIKKIIWENNEPHGIHLRTGRKIKFNSLQFQGGAKRLMGEFYRGKR